jgi:hypothetical protein
VISGLFLASPNIQIDQSRNNRINPPDETARGYGVSMRLATIEGNRGLASLTLMLGALRGPCGARDADHVVRALGTLPNLAELSLVGVAGGFDPAAGGSAALVMQIASQLGASGEPGARPRLRRLQLLGWGPREEEGVGAEALAARVSGVAPELEVVVRHEWAG